ncbi:hypothetical protein SUGI_0842700 [Cryptomeria japonica]|nr:hypothetical protein SUGI_0842700 [Cryptomeria japonica]
MESRSRGPRGLGFEIHVRLRFSVNHLILSSLVIFPRALFRSERIKLWKGTRVSSCSAQAPTGTCGTAEKEKSTNPDKALVSEDADILESQPECDNSEKHGLQGSTSQLHEDPHHALLHSDSRTNKNAQNSTPVTPSNGLLKGSPLNKIFLNGPETPRRSNAGP